MDTKRAISLGLLGLVLFVVLLSANLVVAADRTVLDAEFATDVAEEAGVHETATVQFRETISQEAPASDGDPAFERPQEEILREAFTEEHARAQIAANVDRTYRYLHGETDELRLEIDLEPVKDNVVEGLENATDEVDLGALGVPRGEQIQAMAESEAEFERQREAFREEQKAQIQAETDRELSDEELERQLDERLEEIRERLHAEVQAELDEGFAGDGPEAAIEEPARELAEARIDALTGATTHDEYATRVETATDDLAAAYVAALEADLDEQMPDTMDFTEGMDEGAMEQLRTVREVVSTLDTLAVVLPVVALLLVGLVGWIAPPSLAAVETGAVAALVGALGVAGSQLARSQAEAFVAGEELPAEAADLLSGVVAGVVGTVTWQSALLLAVGLVLLAAGIGIRRGLFLEDLE